jgi:hypothetical protein
MYDSLNRLKNSLIEDPLGVNLKGHLSIGTTGGNELRLEESLPSLDVPGGSGLCLSEGNS